MDGEIHINKTENGYVLNDQNLLSFLNRYKTSSSELKIGDIIFIRGTKIIFMGSYIRVCGIKPVSYNLNLYAKKLVDNTQYVPINELERNISLYDEDNLFFHTPQLKFNIQQADITIDAPPEEVKNEEFPAIFTIGASLMIGLTSVITGVTSVIGIINKTTTIGAAAPSLAISAAMIIGSVILPIFANRYQKKQIIKKEKLRQEKYLEYLNEKKVDIQNAINEQEKILRDNFLDLNSIVNNIKTGNSKIWSKEITDKDFLTLRLGVGNKNANIVINAPVKQFSLEDDNLKESAISIAVSSLHVPAGTSWEPCPIIFVILFLCNFSLIQNSGGTPIASPIACPIIPSIYFDILSSHHLYYSILLFKK